MTGRAATALAAGVEPLRDKRFRRLLVAMAVSALGNSGTLIALSWLVVVELDAGARLGLILAGYTVPQFVVGLIGGALADRYGTRSLSRAGYLASAAILLTMWLLGRAGSLSVAVLAVLVVVAGAAVAVAAPATGALLVSIVDDSRLGPANMLRIIAIDVAVVAGPLGAGVMIAGFGSHAWFLLDAVTFLVAAVVLPAARRGSAGSADGAAMTRFADLVAGMRFVAGRLGLRSGMVAAGLGNLLITVPLLVAIPTVVGGGGLSAGALGGFFALFTVGSVLGAAEAGLVTRSRPLLVALGLLALAGLGVFLLGIGPHGTLLFALAFLVGICIGDFDVRWSAYLQGRVPRELTGRVLACDAWVSFVGRTVGLSTIGLVAVHDPGGVLLACGAVMSLLALGFLFVLSRRSGR